MRGWRLRAKTGAKLHFAQSRRKGEEWHLQNAEIVKSPVEVQDEGRHSWGTQLGKKRAFRKRVLIKDLQIAEDARQLGVEGAQVEV